MDSPRYEVVAAAAFEGDLADARDYYLDQAGPRSASRFLDSYDAFCGLVAQLPGHGAPVGDSGLRWRQLGVFVAVYAVDEEPCRVTLLRLLYLRSSWWARLEGEG